MTLREVRKALAAAKARGAKTAATAPTVAELESLARVLEREAEAKVGARAGKPRLEAAAEQGAAADGVGRRGSRRSPRPRGPRRR